MVLQSSNWCFTLNNYTDNDIERISVAAVKDNITYLIYGKEVGESGTPHLQGFVRFSSKKRVGGVKAVIGGDPHVEVARNPKAAIEYCKKDGEYKEFGEFLLEQGKRNDIETIKKEIQEGNTDMNYFLENHSDFYMRGKGFIQEYIRFNRKNKDVAKHPLYKWQVSLWRHLCLPANDREIIFVVDPIGNTGKSWFARYFNEVHDNSSQILSAGRAADMAHALSENIRVLLIDCPRMRLEYFPYDFVEQVKNGLVFSPKYDSKVKYSNEIPHVVVFMNEMPKTENLSADRVKIISISKEDCVFEEGFNPLDHY